MKAFVYIDGFNLYYGAVRGTRYKWLNLRRMCELLLPRDDIVAIKYFTAKVSARPGDPDQPTRQQMFLRALQTIPNLTVIYGHFLTNEKLMPLAGCRPTEQKFVKVVKTEEKGSDVNLASHLIRDGFRDAYEVAVLVTNDSDLLEPVRIVRHELGKSVGIIHPRRRLGLVWAGETTFTKRLREGVLAASQFPPSLSDHQGVITKPAAW